VKSEKELSDKLAIAATEMSYINTKLNSAE
jgi:hypothetical protein